MTQELERAELDLLAELEDSDNLFEAAHGLAVRGFKDQLTKAGLDPWHVLDARLSVERLSPASATIYGQDRGGRNFRFRARATADTARTFECETVIFVAPNVPEAWRRQYSAIERLVWRLPRTPRVQGRLDTQR